VGDSVATFHAEVTTSFAKDDAQLTVLNKQLVDQTAAVLAGFGDNDAAVRKLKEILDAHSVALERVASSSSSRHSEVTSLLRDTGLDAAIGAVAVVEGFAPWEAALASGLERAGVTMTPEQVIGVRTSVSDSMASGVGLRTALHSALSAVPQVRTAFPSRDRLTDTKNSIATVLAASEEQRKDLLARDDELLARNDELLVRNDKQVREAAIQRQERIVAHKQLLASDGKLLARNDELLARNDKQMLALKALELSHLEARKEAAALGQSAEKSTAALTTVVTNTQNLTSNGNAKTADSLAALQERTATSLAALQERIAEVKDALLTMQAAKTPVAPDATPDVAPADAPGI